MNAVLVWIADHSIFVAVIAAGVAIALKFESQLNARVKRYLFVADIVFIVSALLLGALKDHLDTVWMQKIDERTDDLTQRAERAEKQLIDERELPQATRDKLVNGLRGLGSETVDIGVAVHDANSEQRERELRSVFKEGGWHFTPAPKGLVMKAAIEQGLRVFVPEGSEELQQKGLALTTLFIACDIDVKSGIIKGSNIRIDVGPTFFTPK